MNKRRSEICKRSMVYLGHPLSTLPSNNMFRINQHTTTLSKALLTAGLLGVIGYTNTAKAASNFYDLKVILTPSGEVFKLKIETSDEVPLPLTVGTYTAPDHCEPSFVGSPCSNVTSVIGPQLPSPKYNFKGYKILNITGTAQEGSTIFDVWGPGKAVTSGVFNYPNDDNPINPGPTGSVKADSIPHSLPDQLFNPKGLGFGFDPAGFDFNDPATPAFTSYPADRLDNYFSFGGITFDIGHLAIPGDYTTFTFKEPYQLFTVAYDSTSTGTGESLKAGNYAGCPGSCRGAVVPAPSPLPILGVGAAFGFSRNLRKRIKTSKPGLINAIS